VEGNDGSEGGLLLSARCGFARRKLVMQAVQWKLIVDDAATCSSYG